MTIILEIDKEITPIKIVNYDDLTPEDRKKAYKLYTKELEKSTKPKK